MHVSFASESADHLGLAIVRGDQLSPAIICPPGPVLVLDRFFRDSCMYIVSVCLCLVMGLTSYINELVQLSMVVALLLNQAHIRVYDTDLKAMNFSQIAVLCILAQ